MPADELKSTLYRWHFGTAVFDGARRELQVDGQPVEVQQQPLRVLEMLLADAGKLVTRARFDQALWDERIEAGTVVDNVLANTVSKLRTALGPANAARVVTVPRQGYRLDGPVQCQALPGHRPVLQALAAGDEVPGRPNMVLHRPLGRATGARAGGQPPGVTVNAHPTWLARHAKTGEQRVYKFALDDARLAALQREQRVYRLLRLSLGERADIARVLDWNLDAVPGWLECAWGGHDLAAWAAPTPDGPDAGPDTDPGPGAGPLAALTLPERLALGLQIVDAVAAAQGVGVLHRDIKPTNILIDARPGGGWQVQLTDFGSAALLQPERLAAFNITELGASLPAAANASSPSGSGSAAASTGGTPLYLAPEQVAGEPATVRSDVYALGLVLCQLLRRDFTRPVAAGWQREMADKLLVADIERAIDTQPAQRFVSAAALAEALRSLPQRHVAQADALERATRHAADAAALQRSRARRPWVLGTGLALAAGLAASLWLYQAERQAAQALAQQNSVVQALNQLLTDDLIGAANPAAAGRVDVTVVQALASAAQAIDTRFAGASPQVQASLHAAMQRALSELSRTQDAVAAGQRALAAFARSPAPELDAVQNSRLRLAVDLAQLSRTDEAAAVVAQVEQAEQRRAGAPPGDEFRARLLFAKAWATGGEQALSHSTRLLEQAWALVQPLTVQQAPWRDKIAFSLADNLGTQGRHAEGEALYRQLLASQTAQWGSDHLRTQVTRVGLASSLVMQDKLDDAASLLAPTGQALAQRLGPQHRMTLTVADLQAQVLFKQGRYPQALAAWQPVAAGFSALLGADSSAALAVQARIGLAQHRLGPPAQALPVLQDALARARRSLPETDPQAHYLRYLLASALTDAGQPGPAAALLPGLQPSLLAEAEPGDDWPVQLAWLQGRLLLAQGQRQQALPLLQQAADGLARRPGRGPPTEAAVRARIRKDF